MRRPVFAAVVIAALAAACAPSASETHGTTPTAGAASFGALLAARFDDLKAPGVAYAVVSDGRLLESGGLGQRDVRGGQPVSDATPFRIASLTKPLSAALLLTAAAEGGVDLDTPLVRASTRYRERCVPIKAHFKRSGTTLLDGIDCGDESVTLRTAATHTSRRPAGSRYAYNGFLFGLMSEAIVRAVRPGGSLEAVMRAKVIEPLDLRQTAAGVGDTAAADVVAALAPPHVPGGFGTWRIRDPLTGRLNAAAGLISSAHDLAMIDIALAPGGLVSGAVWREMTAPTLLSDGSRSPYGIGWFVQELEGRKLVWHYGWQPDAYSALWIKDLERGTSLILLANSDGLSRGYRLGRGDVTRSPVARWFLDWSENRAAARGEPG